MIYLKNLKKFYIALLFLLIWIQPDFVFSGQSFYDQSGASDRNRLGYHIQRNITYAFTLQNKSGQLLNKAQFWTYAPIKKTSNQQCILLKTSHPCTVKADDLGNRILCFTFKNIPPYAVRIVRIDVGLLLAQKPVEEKMDGIDKYLVPEKLIESDVEKIFLEVADTNKPAINLYSQESFIEIGRRENYYQMSDGRNDALVLAKLILPLRD